jgi:YesN/AraC family two-component response regulator
VKEANGGVEGIRCPAAEAVDLVMTDLEMPELTGWDVARAAACAEAA